jgi:hypothetical protein
MNNSNDDDFDDDRIPKRSWGKRSTILQFGFRFSKDGDCYFNGIFFNECVRMRFPLSQLSRRSSQFIFTLKKETEIRVSDEPSKSASATEVKHKNICFKTDTKVNYRTVPKMQSGMNFIHLYL